MTVTQSDLRVRSLQAGLGLLHVDRTDISFHNVDAGHVRVAITVRNLGPGRSRPTRARLQSAPLGAFVPWTPLTTLDVPALEQGESKEVSTVVPRPATAPKGFFSDDPPSDRIALGHQDEGKRRRPTGRRKGPVMLELLLRTIWPRRSSQRPNTGTSIPTDLPQLLLGDSLPHWAGNINVMIGDKDVERHMAQALRIEPARTNLALFFVGDQQPDEFKFELKGSGADWDAGLYDSQEFHSLLDRPQSSSALQQSHWLSVNDTRMFLLAFRPPQRCRSAELDVHVTRRSTGKTAIVEFSLDPLAAGPGCYQV